jgi:carbon monoxide dehydrogenase subunit G
MTLEGTYTFNAPRTRVWELLTDPAVLSSCIPGSEGLEPIGDDRYRARVVVAVAMVSGAYEGTVSMLDKVEPESYRLAIEGQGKAGFVKGEARVALREEGATTILEVTGTAEVGGMIARVGQRLVGSVSKMMLDRLFACLQGKV